MNILEELFYSNLNPSNSNFKNNYELKKAIETVLKNEELLTQLLEGKEKNLFLDYTNAHSSINGETAVENFVAGLKLGAKIIQELNN